MSIIAKKKVQFSRGGRVCIRTLRCARPGAGKMLRDSERGAFKFIFLGQSTVCERARYDSVLHSKKERIQKKERVVADHTRGERCRKASVLLQQGVPPTREDEVGHAETT